MSDKAKILIIDDDVFMREILEDILSDVYTVITAGSGEEGCEKASAENPSLILLDVEMPGMDGYEVCRRLKQENDTAPVVFVSAHDKLEERLKGYEAGGSDYIVKPFDPLELKSKIAHLLCMVLERTQLQQMASYASSTAMTAMTSMSEMGALLGSLNAFNASTDVHALAQAVLSGLAQYDLNGVVQVISPGKCISLSAQGEASPLEISVLEHMKGMDRIVHFKRRMSIHYAHVAMLVNNMPIEDAGRCERLRDHLAMLVEGAEMRVAGIIAENESRRRGLAIEQMIGRVTGALNNIDATQRRNRMEMRMSFAALTDKMGAALLQVALTTEQEDFLCGIVSNGIEEIINVQSTEVELQNKLTSLVDEMKQVLG